MRGEVKMRVLFFVAAMFFATVALAGYPKDTLHVERIFVMQNGTGSGKNISGVSFIKRYYTPADCTLAATDYNSQSYVAGGGNSVPAITIAKCEAINHSIYQ